MKTILVVPALLLGILFQATAQHVVWEKTYSWSGSDAINTIEHIGDGYIAGGYMESRGYNRSGSELDEAVLIRLNREGDSINVTNLGFWGHVQMLKRGYNGSFIGAAFSTDTIPLSQGNITSLHIFKLNPEGEVRWQFDVANTVNWLPADICILPDGGFVLIGNKNSQTGGITDGFALRLDSNGTELWRQFFNPSILTYVRHAEVLNGTSKSFLISGNAGARIWAAWLDSSGVVHKEHIYWQDLANTQLYNAGVMQSPDGNLVVMGSNSASGTALAWYLGKFDSTDYNIWGSSQFGGCSNMYVNTQGQTMLAYYDGQNNVFKKYAPNGIVAGSLVLSNSQSNPKGINSCAWSNSDSAVFAGIVQVDRNNYRSDFYFVKMAGVGNGYVSAVPRLVSEEAVRVSLYPNPAATSFRIGGLRVPQSVQLYNLSGQKVYELTAMPDTDIDVQGLPPGLYIVRLQADGVNMGTKKLVVIK